jgi:stage III sporulation protein AA
VDERCELAAVSGGAPGNRVGPSCDVLSGWRKGEGILAAVRTLSPEVIVCDEIGSREEADSILDGLHCGVTVIATAHANSAEELLRRPAIRRLLEQKAFGRVALLAGGDTPGRIRDIVGVGELLGEASGDGFHCSVGGDDGGIPGVRLVGAGTRG